MLERVRRAGNSYKKTPRWLRLLVAAFVILGSIVLTQDVQIFPGAFVAVSDLHKPLPPRVESFTVTTVDGEQIEVWKLQPKLPRSGKLRAALFFGGNGGDIRGFFPYQKWLADIGFIAYAFDYRGYGKSKGWPSEHGLERDSDAAFAELLRREQLRTDQVLLFGLSIGTVPATYVASQAEPGALVLLAPLTKLSDVVQGMPLFRPLIPFLWYEFPTEERIRGLKRTCFVVAHGKADEVIPFDLGRRVYEAYSGLGHSVFLQSERAHHNDILTYERGRVLEAINGCETLD